MELLDSIRLAGGSWSRARADRQALEGHVSIGRPPITVPKVYIKIMDDL